MTRIVAGSHRGRSLRVPGGGATRPTSDRAREGLFNTLAALGGVEGARVLDLYAGTGALGLEALSRGAAAATLVEQADKALAALRRNVDELGLAAEVVAAPAERFLAGAPRPYDVVLLDPPYDVDADPVLAQLVPWLAAGAVVALERRTRGAAPTWPEGLVAERSRRYGEATLWYGSRS